MRKLVIVGAGMATAKLLTELGSQHHDLNIEVIGDEPDACYNRILLSTMLAKDLGADELSLIADEGSALRNVTLACDERVETINLCDKSLSTNKRTAVTYDLLVLATGSSPFLPDIPGIDATDVVTFRSKTDVDRIRSLAAARQQAVVIGGGLLGLESAYGLLGLGANVTVINREPWLMPRQLDEDAASVLRDTLKAQGVQFRLGVTPTQIHSEASVVSGVQLDSGEVLEASMVVVAAGIIPNTSLAVQAGIPSARGILVDNRLRTQVSDVFALGECCEIDGQLFGLVSPVYEQAKILARQLLGTDVAPYQHQEAMTQLKIAGVNVVSSGELPFGAETRSQVLRDNENGIYRRVVFSGSKLTGFILVGDKSHCAWYQALLDGDEDIQAMKPWMMFGNQQSPVSAETLSGLIEQ